MAVKTKQEARAVTENCFWCNKETGYWHQEKDVPVCLDCSQRIREEDVPSKADWLSDNFVRNFRN